MSNTSDNISAFLYCEKQIPFAFIWVHSAMVLCFFLGTPAYSWLLWLFLRTGWKIKPTQVFPLTLVVVDLFFCIHLGFNTLNTFVFSNRIISAMSYLIFGLSWGCRLLIQVCVCIEQYLAVVHPITFLRYKAVHYRTASGATLWLMSSGYGLLLVTGVLKFPDYVFSFVCFMGLVVISFCCMSVLRVLKHPGPGEREISKERGRDVGNQQKRNAFNAIATVLIIVLFSYLPLSLISLFLLMNVNMELFDCTIAFIMLAIHMHCVMITPLLKLYNDGQLKCRSNHKKNRSG